MSQFQMGGEGDGLNKPPGSHWTDAQWRAIARRGRNVLVAAAAGSGKTAVLVERIIRQVSDEQRPVDVDRLLVATFTKAAASEMRHRIGEALEKALFANPDSDHLKKQLALLSRASITTLHSFCMDVIRRYFHLIDLDPGFRVADDTEAALLRQEELEGLLGDCYGEADSDHPFWDLVEWFGGERSDEPLMDLILQLYEASRSHPFPGRWLASMGGMFSGGPEKPAEAKSGELESAETPDVTPDGAAQAAGQLWFDTLLKDVRLELDGLAALLEEGVRVCGLTGGPAPYATTLVEELGMVRGLAGQARSGWEELHQAFTGVAFGKLKPVKADSCDKELQEQVKKLRNEAKDRLVRLREELFVRTQDEYMGELRQLFPLIQELVRLTEAFADRYQTAKREKGLLDFTDLEHLCLSILGKSKEDGTGLEPTEAALAYREQFVEIMVDEYQDTNLVQETIVELISRSGPGNRFMVGDVKQSIYRFRLAEPGLFLDKYGRYQPGGAEGGDGERIDLSRNFRSRRQVVNAANDLFRRIMRPTVAEMEYDQAAELVFAAPYADPEEQADEGSGWPDMTAELVVMDRSTDRGRSEQPGDDGEDNGAGELSEDEAMTEGGALEAMRQQEAAELEAAQLEARYIGKRIRELTGMDGQAPMLVTQKDGSRRPASFQDVVILLRAIRGWGPVLMEELALMGVPAFAEISTGYFAALEVETVLSLLKVIDNPRQDIPLAAVLRSPLCGLSAEELARIRLADRQGDYYSALQAWLHEAGERMRTPQERTGNSASGILLPHATEAGTVWRETAAAAEPETEELAMVHKLLLFQQRLSRWREEARHGSLSRLIAGIYRDTGYYDYVGGLPGGSQCQANLLALQDRARQYESTSFRGLYRFLRFVERMRESGGDLGTAKVLGEQEDVVRIMTIHKSKGLEFPVVFVAGAGKSFNLMDQHNPFLIHKELGFGPRFMDPALRAVYPTLPQLAIRRRMRMEALAEEMRVLYVALTRAKEKLVLTGSVRGLPARLESWRRGISPGMAHLPDYKLAGARTYLDWLAPALLCHPELEKSLIQPQEQGGDTGELGMSFKPSAGICPWRLKTVSAGLLLSQSAEDEEAGEADERENLVAAVRTLTPLYEGTPADSSEIHRRLSWQYEYGDGGSMLAKTTVSELKRLDARQVLRAGVDDGWEAPLLPGLEPVLGEDRSERLGAPLYRLPRFRAARKLTPAEAGIAYHTAMQHMPLGEGLDEQQVRSIIAGLEERGLLTREEAAVLDAESITAFFATPLGRRLARAPVVQRELPFSYGLRAGEVYPDCSSSTADEIVLIQGVIDCLFEDEQGALVLVDYKTDRIKGLDDRQLADRYRVQLELYSRAIEGIWKRKVNEKALYYFDGARIVLL